MQYYSAVWTSSSVHCIYADEQHDFDLILNSNLKQNEREQKKRVLPRWNENDRERVN